MGLLSYWLIEINGFATFGLQWTGKKWIDSLHFLVHSLLRRVDRLKPVRSECRTILIVKVVWIWLESRKPTLLNQLQTLSCLERNSKPYLRVTRPLLYQLSYRVNWEQYGCFVHHKSTRDSHDNLTLIREDVHCFDSIQNHAQGDMKRIFHEPILSLTWSVNHEIFCSCHPEDDFEIKWRNQPEHFHYLQTDRRTFSNRGANPIRPQHFSYFVHSGGRLQYYLGS